MTELSVLQEVQMRELGSADFRQTLDGFLKMATILDRRGYMEAIAYRSRVLRGWLAFLESYPVVLTPLSVKRTPDRTDDPIKGIIKPIRRKLSRVGLLPDKAPVQSSLWRLSRRE